MFLYVHLVISPKKVNTSHKFNISLRVRGKSKGPVINYGDGGKELQNSKGGGGQVQFYPYKKGDVWKPLAMLKGGHKRLYGSFNTEIFAILEWGANSCRPFPIYLSPSSSSLMTSP